MSLVSIRAALVGGGLADPTIALDLDLPNSNKLEDRNDDDNNANDVKYAVVHVDKGLNINVHMMLAACIQSGIFELKIPLSGGRGWIS